MKTKPIPSIVMLSAGLIRCIVGVIYPVELKSFLISLLLILVLFYFIGAIVKIVIDKNVIIEDEPEEAEADNEESDEELENIDDEGDSVSEVSNDSFDDDDF